MAQKNISVREETKKKLDSMKRYPRETYDGVITSVLSRLKTLDREPWEWMGDDEKGEPQWRRKFKRDAVMVPASLLPGEKGYEEQQRKRSEEID